jgi:hypothetical protein
MDVQSATAIITGISIIIGIIVFILSRRQELETRQAALFMQVYDRWNTRDIQMAYGNTRFLLLPQIKDFEDYQRLVLNERAKGNLEPWFHGQILITYFEGLAMLVKRGLIDSEMVEDLFANRINWYWEAFKDIAEMRRSQLRDPKMYDSVEYLYQALKQRQHTTVNT